MSGEGREEKKNFKKEGEKNKQNPQTPPTSWEGSSQINHGWFYLKKKESSRI